MDHNSAFQQRANSFYTIGRHTKPTPPEEYNHGHPLPVSRANISSSHVTQHTVSNNYIPSNTMEHLHWPIVDLVGIQARSFPSSPTTSTIVTHPDPAESRRYEQDKDLFTMSTSNQRASLAGSDLPQGLIAYSDKRHKGMGPMERFVAETYEQIEQHFNHHEIPAAGVSSSRMLTKGSNTKHGKSSRSRR